MAPIRTFLCFDFGLSNIGVAVGNTLIGQARPIAILPASNGKPDWLTVQALVDEWNPSALVVGNPLGESGEATELSEKAARFARQLHGRSSLEVKLCDERFSSKEAKSRARDAGHKGDYAKQPIDDLAAAIILESYLQLEA